jgi:hypothetical protein
MGMNKAEFIKKLETYGFPKSEFVILSGGSLLLRGLREETADLDLSCSQKLAEELNLKNCAKDEAGCFVPYEDVQMKPDMEGRAYDIIEGYQCQTITDILALKRRLMRPKDMRDIEVIEEWMKGEKR